MGVGMILMESLQKTRNTHDVVDITTREREKGKERERDSKEFYFEKE